MLAMERPVIGTELSGIPEVVNGDTGILVPPEDEGTLANAMETISEREPVT